MTNENHDIIAEKMAIVAGKSRPTLSRAQQETLSRAYMELFIGLAAANWARNDDKTLGAAWYEAQGQIKSMLGARDKNNPATEYLSQVAAAHNIQMSRQMMTHPNKDTTADIPESLRTEWNARASKSIGTAMAAINKTTKEFTTRPTAQHAQPDATPQKSQPFSDAREKLLQQQQILMAILAKQKQNGAA